MNTNHPWCGARARITLASLSLLALWPAAAHADFPFHPPVVLDAPVAPPLPKGQGTGLCVTSAIAADVATFTLSREAFNAGINTFLETQTKRTTSVLQSIFDLSNNNLFGEPLSAGDFTDAMPGDCQTGGCGFFLNDSTTHFASRFRGFLNVTGELVGRPVHLGLYLDDAASVTFFDKSIAPHPLITIAPVIGAPTWRATNTITFKAPGLYPVEILYAEIVEHAALEVSHLDSATFVDFELPKADVTSTNLKSAGFTLFKKADFYTTVRGGAPYANLSECKQCDRQFVNTAGNNGCDPGYRCNEAALCSPCDSDSFCGPTCAACGGETPVCLNMNGTYACAAAPPEPSGTGGSGSSSSAASGSGGGAGGETSGSEGGCSCGVGGAPATGGLWLGLGLALLASRRRRPRRPLRQRS